MVLPFSHERYRYPRLILWLSCAQILVAWKTGADHIIRLDKQILDLCIATEENGGFGWYCRYGNWNRDSSWNHAFIHFGSADLSSGTSAGYSLDDIDSKCR